MRIIKRLSIVALFLLAVIQARRPSRTNPASDPARILTVQAHISSRVAGVLDRSCGDCHSNQTRWPWYSEVAPFSWMVASHVNDGRRHLNLSEWPGKDSKKADNHLDEICKVVRAGFMPLSSYTLVHRNARLSTEEIEAICTWTAEERARLAEGLSQPDARTQEAHPDAQPGRATDGIAGARDSNVPPRARG